MSLHTTNWARQTHCQPVSPKLQKTWKSRVNQLNIILMLNVISERQMKQNWESQLFWHVVVLSWIWLPGFSHGWKLSQSEADMMNNGKPGSLNPGFQNRKCVASQGTFWPVSHFLCFLPPNPGDNGNMMSLWKNSCVVLRSIEIANCRYFLKYKTS